jgi:glycosyltransferase involved in cell wall biosynthesis
MRVLMQPRSDMLSGGEATQIRETAAMLRRRGVAVDVDDSLRPDLRGIDIVHVFGLTQPAEPLRQAEHASGHGIPVVLSPAYQDLSEYNSRGRFGLAAWAYRLLPAESFAEAAKLSLRIGRARGRRLALAGLLPLPLERQQRRLLRRAALVLPNSAAEAGAIAAHFDHRGASRVVPYGVAASTFAGATGDAFRLETGLRDFVIAVGFISSLKNQLRLIAALEGTGLRLVIAGSRVPTHAAFYRAVCDAARRSGVTMLGHVPHERLASALAAARVVALPSWFETCGMACLEGAVAGCRVVVTNRGYTREYFGEDASYCDPGDVDSIRRAILEAADAPIPVRLRDRVLSEYTWEASAEATLDGYWTVLDGRNRVDAGGRRPNPPPCV